VKHRSLLALTVPVGAVGCLAGHAAGYALVGAARQDALIHGYLAFAPQFLALCVGLVAIAFVLRLTGRLQGRLAAWPFAFLPPLAFLAQETVERVVAGLPAGAVFEAPVYAGLAAQVPVGILAFLVARLLLRAADAAARTLAPAPILLLRPGSMPAALPATRLAWAPLSFDHLGRAPPRR